MAKRNRNRPNWPNPKYTTVTEVYVRDGYRGETAIDIPSNKADEIISWCKATFGEDGSHHRYHWRVNNITRTRIFVRREDFVMMFKLKWL